VLLALVGRDRVVHARKFRDLVQVVHSASGSGITVGSLRTPRASRDLVIHTGQGSFFNGSEYRQHAQHQHQPQPRLNAAFSMPDESTEAAMLRDTQNRGGRALSVPVESTEAAMIRERGQSQGRAGGGSFREETTEAAMIRERDQSLGRAVAEGMGQRGSVGQRGAMNHQRSAYFEESTDAAMIRERGQSQGRAGGGSFREGTTEAAMIREREKSQGRDQSQGRGQSLGRGGGADRSGGGGRSFGEETTEAAMLRERGQSLGRAGGSELPGGASLEVLQLREKLAGQQVTRSKTCRSGGFNGFVCYSLLLEGWSHGFINAWLALTPLHSLRRTCLRSTSVTRRRTPRGWRRCLRWHVRSWRRSAAFGRTCRCVVASSSYCEALVGT